MPKVSFRMASAYREWVFGVQTNTARKIHRSDHTEGRLTTAPSGCCVRKGTVTGTRRASISEEEVRWDYATSTPGMSPLQVLELIRGLAAAIQESSPEAQREVVLRVFRRIAIR